MLFANYNSSVAIRMTKKLFLIELIKNSLIDPKECPFKEKDPDALFYMCYRRGIPDFKIGVIRDFFSRDKFIDFMSKNYSGNVHKTMIREINNEYNRQLHERLCIGICADIFEEILGIRVIGKNTKPLRTRADNTE